MKVPFCPKMFFKDNINYCLKIDHDTMILEDKCVGKECFMYNEFELDIPSWYFSEKSSS
jgi:hypothetical protein